MYLRQKRKDKRNNCNYIPANCFPTMKKQHKYTNLLWFFSLIKLLFSSFPWVIVHCISIALWFRIRFLCQIVVVIHTRSPHTKRRTSSQTMHCIAQLVSPSNVITRRVKREESLLEDITYFVEDSYDENSLYINENNSDYNN